MISRRALIHVALLVTLWLTLAVRASQSAPPPAVFAYSATAEGKLYGFRVGDNGDLKPLANGAAVTSVMERPMIAAHVSGRYLYVATAFDAWRDDYNYDEAMSPKKAEPKRKTTDLLVCRIRENGALERIQSLTVDTQLGGLLPHPAGKLIYGVAPKGKLIVFRLASDGRLTRQGETKASNTISLLAMLGERDEWDISFTPDGRYAYCFEGDGFIDHQENYLQHYRVLADGRFQAVGARRETKSYELIENEQRVTVDVGPVTFVPQKRLALVAGMSGRIWLYRLSKSGQFITYRQKYLPHPPSDNWEYIRDYFVKAVDPRGRFLYTGSRYTETANTCYRITADARFVRVGTFGGTGSIVPEPTGRFVYELERKGAELGRPDRPYLTVYRVGNNGQVTVSVPRRLMMDANVTQILFAVPGASGAVKRK